MATPTIRATIASLALTLAAAAAAAQQQAYLKASNTDPGDNFGGAIACSGDVVIVGATGEQNCGGAQVNNGCFLAGAAYVYDLAGGFWSQAAYLKASDVFLPEGASGVFGHSVAIDGETAAVGAIGHDNSSGAVYVFVKVGSTWSEQARLKAAVAGLGDGFGRSVSLSGDTLVVGAHLEDGGSSGVGGDPADDSAPDAGAAYVFVRSGSTWTQQAYLKASHSGAGARFGHAVAVSGDTAAVSSYSEPSAATGVGGDQLDQSAPGAGAVYVFTRSGATWSQQAYVKASNTDAGDHFGSSLALDADTLCVGAGFEASAAVGPDGDQGDDGNPGAGAVYVFQRAAGAWAQEAYLKASHGTPNGLRLGLSGLGLSGDRLVAGAPGDSSAATGTNGDPTGGGATNSGAAFVFSRSGGRWAQSFYLKASNTGTSDSFGHAAAIDAGRVVVGALFEDGSSTGVNGVEQDEGAPDAGAAYLFDLPTTVGSARCFCGPGSAPCANDYGPGGCRNSVGLGAILAAVGSTSAATQGPSPLVLTVTQARPDKACMWLQGGTQQQAPFRDGLLCVGNPTLRLPGYGCGLFPVGTLDATGRISTDDPVYGFDVLGAALCRGDDIAAVAPTTRDYQLWYRDGMGPCGSGSNTSNAVSVGWTP